MLGVALGSVRAKDVKLESIVTYKVQYDTKKSTETALKVVASINDGCVGSVVCGAAGGVYPATQCITSDRTSGGVFYSTVLPAVFGDAPYVVLQKYTNTATCADPADIETLTAYLPDGICHNTGTVGSFKAIRAADGAAKILTYGMAACSGATSDEVIISAQQASVNSCATGNGCRRHC